MGVSDASKTAPKMKLERERLPYAYGMMAGLFEPVIRSGNIIKVARTYIQRFLIYPVAGGQDDIEDGAESNIRALDWIDIGHAYYAAHPTLGIGVDSTAVPGGLPELVGCEGVISTGDPGGLIARRAPGGLNCAAIDLQLNIIMAARLDRIALPYSS
jgi:hypothetical protein